MMADPEYGPSPRSLYGPFWTTPTLRKEELDVLGRFDYVRPSTVRDAVAHLAGEGAVVLAGGTDLLVDLRSGRSVPRLLVDIKRITELTRLEVAADRPSVVGAAVPLSALLSTLRTHGVYSGWATAVASIATTQLRHRATAVGNLCHASPAADLAPILLVLGAEVVATSPRGERTLPLSRLFVGVRATSLARGELVTEVRIPPSESGLRCGFTKQKRLRGHDLAVASAAVAYRPSTRTLQLAIGSCAPTPLLLPSLHIAGGVDDAATEACNAAQAAIRPISDARSSAAYRAAVLPVLVRRLVADVLGKGGSPSNTRSI